jgi:hypothetical protein
LNSSDISADAGGTAPYLQLAADQGYAQAPDKSQEFLVGDRGLFSRPMIDALTTLAAWLDFESARSALAETTDPLSRSFRESLSKKLLRRKELKYTSSAFSFLCMTGVLATCVIVDRLRSGWFNRQHLQSVQQRLAQNTQEFATRLK